jgi:excisionase family DNA binding protein
MEPVYLKCPDICKALSISKPTFYRIIAAGQFPRGTLIGERSKRWRRTDLDRYIRSVEAGVIFRASGLRIDNKS